MKKKLLLGLLFIGLLFITGCTAKEKLEPSNFKKIMEKKGFIVTEQTGVAIAEGGNVDISYKAETPDQRYVINFYEFDGEVSAQGFYAKKQAELGSTGSQVYTELNLGNYSKYTMIYHERFAAISRVSNTVVHVDTEKNYQEEVKQLLLDIGY